MQRTQPRQIRILFASNSGTEASDRNMPKMGSGLSWIPSDLAVSFTLIDGFSNPL